MTEEREKKKEREGAGRVERVKEVEVGETEGKEARTKGAAQIKKRNVQREAAVL